MIEKRRVCWDLVWLRVRLLQGLWKRAEGPTAVLCDFSLVIYPDSAKEAVWQTGDDNEYAYIRTDELYNTCIYTFFHSFQWNANPLLASWLYRDIPFIYIVCIYS